MLFSYYFDLRLNMIAAPQWRGFFCSLSAKTPGNIWKYEINTFETMFRRYLRSKMKIKAILFCILLT